MRIYNREMFIITRRLVTADSSKHSKNVSNTHVFVRSGAYQVIRLFLLILTHDLRDAVRSDPSESANRSASKHFLCKARRCLCLLPLNQHLVCNHLIVGKSLLIMSIHFKLA